MDLYIDARTMSSRPSGVGIYLFDLLKELVKYQDINITLLTDIADSEEINYFKEINIKIILYGKRVYKSAMVLNYFKFIQEILKKNQPDIFWEPNNLIPIQMKDYHGKLLLTIHDLFPITMPEYFGLIYQVYFRVNIKKSVKQAHKIIYNSKDTLNDVKKYYNRLLPNDNMVCYPNVPKVEVNEKLICDKNYFLYIGNMEKRKGVDLLLKAYAKYRAEGGTKELHLVGKMREKDIEELLRRCEEDDKGIIYHGYVSLEKKHKLISECSCFVFPSKAEGFGIPPIEVMNFGKPIILSELPIFQEIIGTSVNYFSLSKNEYEQIENLKQRLFDYHNGEAKEYKTVIQRYTTQNQGEILYQFILEGVL